MERLKVKGEVFMYSQRMRLISSLELKVFVNLFLQQYDNEIWKVRAVCCHEKEEAEKTEERYKKKGWKSSDDWWEFPLNKESEDKVIIQLADDMKDYWSQEEEEDIVFQRSSLMASANTSQRIKTKQSLPARSLHFKARYGKSRSSTEVLLTVRHITGMLFL